MSDADLQASIRNVTLAELAGAVAAVDEVARESFRCGPIPREGRREGCRMCQTLKRAARAEGAERGYEMEWLEERVLVPGDPYGVLWAWHESHEMIIARAWTRTFVQANPSVEEIRRYGNATTAAADDGDRVGDAFAELAGAASFYRCTLVYLLAGWKP
jgi:hypothetical protein